MSEQERRNIARDSVFMMANLRLSANGQEFRVKVRNLSTRGLMVEGAPPLALGATVEIALRHLGWVGGQVAWVVENRAGVALIEEIDPKLVLAPSGPGEEVAGGYKFRTPIASKYAFGADPRFLRKI